MSLADLDMTYVMQKLSGNTAPAPPAAAGAGSSGHMGYQAQGLSPTSSMATVADFTGYSLAGQDFFQGEQQQEQTCFVPVYGTPSQSSNRGSNCSGSPPIVTFEDATSVDRLLAQANLVAIASPAQTGSGRHGSPFCRSPRDNALSPRFSIHERHPGVSASAAFSTASVPAAGGGGAGGGYAGAGSPRGVGGQQRVAQFLPVTEMQELMMQQGDSGGYGDGFKGGVAMVQQEAAGGTGYGGGGSGFTGGMAVMHMPTMQLEEGNDEMSMTGLQSGVGLVHETEVRRLKY